MKKWSEKNGVEFWTMPVNRAEEGLEVMRNAFFPDEAFCVSVGVSEDRNAQIELEALAVESAQDEVSIMAIDQKSKKIVGVSYNKFQVATPREEQNYFQKFRDTKCKNKRAVALMDEMLWCDTLADIYDKYEVKCSLEVMFLAVHSDFRKRGIGIGCVDASLALARSLPSTKCPNRPPLVTSIFTSPHSIKIGRALGFNEVVVVSMEERCYEGKRFCDNPKVGHNHPGATVMAIRL